VLLNGTLAEVNSYGLKGYLPHTLTKHVIDANIIDIGYDEFGRQTTKGTERSISKYSDHNLPKELAVAGEDYLLSYDALGQRARKTGPTSDWVYAGELYERRVDNRATSHVFPIFADFNAAPEGAGRERDLGTIGSVERSPI
jgi:hypothetical protein